MEISLPHGPPANSVAPRPNPRKSNEASRKWFLDIVSRPSTPTSAISFPHRTYTLSSRGEFLSSGRFTCARRETTSSHLHTRLDPSRPKAFSDQDAFINRSTEERQASSTFLFCSPSPGRPSGLLAMPSANVSPLHSNGESRVSTVHQRQVIASRNLCCRKFSEIAGTGSGIDETVAGQIYIKL